MVEICRQDYIVSSALCPFIWQSGGGVLISNSAESDLLIQMAQTPKMCGLHLKTPKKWITLENT